ncbi:MAG: hypothetical protein MZW92_63455 [Comamonadaceae bacterium]|nr:hypothetical protein [Comamonadaceae bacterium]
MVGIDCHIGSQITEIEPYLDALDRLLDLVEAVEARGHRAATTSTSAAAWASPTPTRRRRAADELVARAAGAHRRARPRPPRAAVRARAARWSATPACC